MNGFRLADQTIHWQGVDGTTPAGCSLAVGEDRMGNMRVWLFRGETPADDQLLGNVLMPQESGRSAIAYRAQNGYLASGYDQTELLAKIAVRAQMEV
jgi:hypothetical protein